jgi:hypothetical protein
MQYIVFLQDETEQCLSILQNKSNQKIYFMSQYHLWNGVRGSGMRKWDGRRTTETSTLMRGTIGCTLTIAFLVGDHCSITARRPLSLSSPYSGSLPLVIYLPYFVFSSRGLFFRTDGSVDAVEDDESSDLLSTLVDLGLRSSSSSLLLFLLLLLLLSEAGRSFSNADRGATGES